MEAEGGKIEWCISNRCWNSSHALLKSCWWVCYLSPVISASPMDLFLDQIIPSCCLNGLDYSKVSPDLKIDRTIGAFEEAWTFHYTEKFFCIHYYFHYSLLFIIHYLDLSCKRNQWGIQPTCENMLFSCCHYGTVWSQVSLWRKYQILCIKKNAVLKSNVYCMISKISNCEFYTIMCNIWHIVEKMRGFQINSVNSDIRRYFKKWNKKSDVPWSGSMRNIEYAIYLVNI